MCNIYIMVHISREPFALQTESKHLNRIAVPVSESCRMVLGQPGKARQGEKSEEA